MLIEEKNAGDMICPQRMDRDAPAYGELGTRCCGSKCMAWRSVRSQQGERGYCGLAGMPAEVNQAIIGKAMAPALNLALGMTGGHPSGLVLPEGHG